MVVFSITTKNGCVLLCLDTFYGIGAHSFDDLEADGEDSQSIRIGSRWRRRQ